MRLALFVSHPIPYCAPVWRELASRPDIEVTVFYFSTRGVEESHDPGFGRAFAWDVDLTSGYDHEFLPRVWPTDPNSLDWTMVNSGLAEAMARGWDAVFVNGYAILNNWLVVALARMHRMPVLCYGDTTVSDQQGRSLLRRVGKRALLSWYFKDVGAYLAAGGQARDYFAALGASPDSLFICPYAVDVDRFRRRVREAGPSGVAAFRKELGIPDGKRIALFCGKLVPWKRPQDVADAVALTGRDDVVAVFVGDGEMRDELAAKGAHVYPVGFINQADLPLAYAMADVFVLPSSREPYGVVAAEAQSVGVPAIVSEACGCHGPGSVVQDGETGYVVPVADVVALANRITRLVDDADLHERMSAAARTSGDSQSVATAADSIQAAMRHVVTGDGTERTAPAGWAARLQSVNPRRPPRSESKPRTAPRLGPD